MKDIIEKIEGQKYNYHGKVVHYSKTSLFCFSGTNKLRSALVWLVTHPKFDLTITVVIVINSILLGIRDYDDRLKGPEYKSTLNETMFYVNFGFSVIFLFEAIFKIIAMGFVISKHSYLRDTWNWLDFFVVLVSVTDVIPGTGHVGLLKGFRTIRILRPLRSINKIKSLKRLINSLLKSIPGLANVGFFLGFVLSIFAIFAVHQFKGMHYKRCRMTYVPDLKPDYSHVPPAELDIYLKTHEYKGKHGV